MTHDSGGRQSELGSYHKNDSVGTKQESACNISTVIRVIQSKMCKFVAKNTLSQGEFSSSIGKNALDFCVHANVYLLSQGFTVQGLLTQPNFYAQQN